MKKRMYQIPPGGIYKEVSGKQRTFMVPESRDDDDPLIVIPDYWIVGDGSPVAKRPKNWTGIGWVSAMGFQYTVNREHVRRYR